MAARDVRAIVVSPHLDDAVLSCGDWLQAHEGATVVTVFAGVPADGSQRTDWDQRSGFADARRAIAARRAEDRAALALLQARPHWLDFPDDQYRERVDDAAVVAALRTIFAAADDDAPVLLPLGLFHRDHLRTHAAGIDALLTLGRPRCWLYEESPYRARAGLVAERVKELADDGFSLRPDPALTRPPSPAKAAAVQAYGSQLRALGPGALADSARPERYWRLRLDGRAS